MGTCYLHIGVPKTGSTSIQASLASGQQQLAEHGYYYPVFEINHRFLTSAFLERPETFDYNEFLSLSASEINERNDNNLRRLESEFQASGCTNLVLSSEHLVLLSELSIRRLQDYLHANFANTIVVVYFRHPLSSAASMIQEMIKNGVSTLDLLTAHPPFNRPKRILKSWSRCFDPKFIRVRDFSYQSLVNHDLIADFLYCIDFRGDVNLFPRLYKRQSLSMPAVLIANQLASLYPKYSPARAPQHRLSLLLERIPGPKYFPDPATVAVILEQATTELAYLREEWSLSLKTPSPADVLLNPTQANLWTTDVLRSLAMILNLLAASDAKIPKQSDS
ncbi:MAG: hypothetical protein ACK6AD_02935 [Cyanobacteriota bacterium]